LVPTGLLNSIYEAAAAIDFGCNNSEGVYCGLLEIVLDNLLFYKRFHDDVR